MMLALTSQQKVTLVHAASAAGAFLLALFLDLSGHLSPQGHTLAVTLVGGLGLSTAVSAFRARPPIGGPLLEQALVDVLASHIPSLFAHGKLEMSRARAAFGAYLARELGPLDPPAAAETSPATPSTKQAERDSRERQ